MQIKIVKPNKQSREIIQKITVFRTDNKIVYQQKLTPSPFTCISYNHFDIPEFKVNGKIKGAKNSLQFTGPKTNDNIFAVHNGKLHQILIELSPSSFYYLFNQSPSEIVNQTVDFRQFVDKTKSESLLDNLKKNNNYISRIKKLTDFLLDQKSSALPKIDYIEKAISLIDKSSGHTSVNAICELSNISERQFNRKFSEIIKSPTNRVIKTQSIIRTYK